MTEFGENVGKLIDRYGDTVLRIAYTYLKNKPDAEDAVQEVFLHIIEKILFSMIKIMKKHGYCAQQ